MNEEQCYFEKQISAEPKEPQRAELNLVDLSDRTGVISGTNRDAAATAQQADKSITYADANRSKASLPDVVIADRSIPYVDSNRSTAALPNAERADRSIPYTDINRTAGLAKPELADRSIAYTDINRFSDKSNSQTSVFLESSASSKDDVVKSKKDDKSLSYSELKREAVEPLNGKFAEKEQSVIKNINAEPPAESKADIWKQAMQIEGAKVNKLPDADKLSMPAEGKRSKETPKVDVDRSFPTTGPKYEPIIDKGVESKSGKIDPALKSFPMEKSSSKEKVIPSLPSRFDIPQIKYLDGSSKTARDTQNGLPVLNLFDSAASSTQRSALEKKQR